MTKEEPVEKQRTFAFYEVLPRERALTATKRASKNRSASARLADATVQVAKATKVDAPIDVSAVRKETQVHAVAEQSSTSVGAGIEIATWEIGRFAVLRVWLNGHHISQRKVLSVLTVIVLTGVGIAAYGNQVSGVVESLRQWAMPQSKTPPGPPPSPPLDAQKTPSPTQPKATPTPAPRTKRRSCWDIDDWFRDKLGIDTCG